MCHDLCENKKFAENDVSIETSLFIWEKKKKGLKENKIWSIKKHVSVKGNKNRREKLGGKKMSSISDYYL